MSNTNELKPKPNNESTFVNYGTGLRAHAGLGGGSLETSFAGAGPGPTVCQPGPTKANPVVLPTVGMTSYAVKKTLFFDSKEKARDITMKYQDLCNI